MQVVVFYFSCVAKNFVTFDQFFFTNFLTKHKGASLFVFEKTLLARAWRDNARPIYDTDEVDFVKKEHLFLLLNPAVDSR